MHYVLLLILGSLCFLLRFIQYDLPLLSLTLKQCQFKRPLKYLTRHIQFDLEKATAADHNTIYTNTVYYSYSAIIKSIL